MSSNLFSSFNDSLTQPDESSSDSILFLYMFCLRTNPTIIIFTTFKFIRTSLILPLCILIVHHGLQQWKQRRSTSSSSTISHSDCFTYHLVVMELIVLLGYIFSLVGLYRNDSDMLFFGILFRFFNWYGEMCFHVLTCLERYLAVVHPITYLNYRNERGIRLRNIGITFVWLLCLVGMSLLTVNGFEKVFSFSLLIISLMASSFCSLSVLSILLRPGPGTKGEKRKMVNPSKQRAFHTLMVVSSALLTRFVWDVFWLEIITQGEKTDCVIKVFGFWFTLPCSLVLPLLFLHRKGKLASFRKSCLIKG